MFLLYTCLSHAFSFSPVWNKSLQSEIKPYFFFGYYYITDWEQQTNSKKKYYNEWGIFNSVKTFESDDYSDRQHRNSIHDRVSTK